MSEPAWQPIETAPTDVRVYCGGWEKSYNVGDPLVWKEDPGVAWERSFWGSRRKTYHGKEYSHWKPLPAPPQNNAPQTPETQAQSTTSPPLINQV